MSGVEPVIVVRTGVANLASVLAGFRRIGVPAGLSDDAAVVRAAPAVVLPGVGSFDAGMAELDRAGLTAALCDRIAADLPTLAICLGMQLLFGHSEESRSGRRGLCVLPGGATRFRGDVRVPQLGWNRLDAAPDCVVLRSGHAYFANSYRVTAAPPDCRVAMAEHGEPFIAALERGRLLACQFHPELSGSFGRDLLRAFVATATEVRPC